MIDQTPPEILKTTHRLLSGLLLLGMLGLGIELILLGHYEEFKQWIPLAMIGIGIAAHLLLLSYRSQASIKVFQGAMILFVAGGILGTWFHFNGNREFELEMYPSLSGVDLLWESLTGATPALSPGTMILLGLLGLTLAYTHSALINR